MTLHERCLICRKADLRRLIHLGWNAKMDAPALAAVFGNTPSATAIMKHLREHVDEGASIREIPVDDARPIRSRVLDLQRLQLDEIERRIMLAQERAVYAREHGNEQADWSDFYDIIGKDAQAAISSILKAQGLTDKRELGQDSLKVDVYRLMLGGGDGLAPPRLAAGTDAIEGEAHEIRPDEET